MILKTNKNACIILLIGIICFTLGAGIASYGSEISNENSVKEKSYSELDVENLPLIESGVEFYRDIVREHIWNGEYFSFEEKQIYKAEGYSVCEDEMKVVYFNESRGMLETYNYPVLVKDSEGTIKILSITENGKLQEQNIIRTDWNVSKKVYKENVHHVMEDGEILVEESLEYSIVYEPKTNMLAYWELGSTYRWYPGLKDMTYEGECGDFGYLFKKDSIVYFVCLKQKYSEGITIEILASGVDEIISNGKYARTTFVEPPIFKMEDGTYKMYIKSYMNNDSDNRDDLNLQELAKY